MFPEAVESRAGEGWRAGEILVNGYKQSQKEEISCGILLHSSKTIDNASVFIYFEGNREKDFE